MDTRRVGRSGLRCPGLGLGTMTWGRDTDADEAAAQLEAFVGAGGHADRHGQRLRRRRGRSHPRHPGAGRRAAFVVMLATTTVGVGGGRGRLLDALDASLRRLGTDHVDLWQVHGFDAAVPFEETCSALRAAVQSGRARYVGLSGVTAGNWPRSRPGCARPRRRPIAVETEYSLVERSAGGRPAGRRRRARASGCWPGPRSAAGCSPASTGTARPPTPAARHRISPGTSAGTATSRRPGSSRPWSPLPRAWALRRWPSPAPGCGTGRASRRPSSAPGIAAQLLGVLKARGTAAARRDRFALDDVSAAGESDEPAS